MEDIEAFLSSYTITTLKIVCTQLKLDHIGTKDVLIERLIEFDNFDLIKEHIDRIILTQCMSTLSV